MTPPTYVNTKHICCPRCGGADYQSKRTYRDGDGELLRHAVCRLCGWKFVIDVSWPEGVRNLPNFGKRKKRSDRMTHTQRPNTRPDTKGP